MPYASDYMDNPFDLSKMRSPEDCPEIMKVLWSDDRLRAEIASRSNQLTLMETAGIVDTDLSQRLIYELNILFKFRDTPTVKQKLDAEVEEMEDEEEASSEVPKRTLVRAKTDGEKPVTRKMTRR